MEDGKGSSDKIAVHGQRSSRILILSIRNKAKRLSALLDEKAVARRSSITEATDASGSKLIRNASHHQPNTLRKPAEVYLLPDKTQLAICGSLERLMIQLQITVNKEVNEQQQLYGDLMFIRKHIDLMHQTSRHCSVCSQSTSNFNANESDLESFVVINSSESEDETEILKEEKLPSVTIDEQNSCDQFSRIITKGLPHVMRAIKGSGDTVKLNHFQEHLDKSAFNKLDHPIVHSFRHFNFAYHKLVHEGPLIWRLHKEKSIKIRAVLLEDVLVLLQEQDEKYIMKFLDTNLAGSKDTKSMRSPILQLRKLVVGTYAADEKSFSLLLPSELTIYQFVAATKEGKKTWCQFLTETVEAAKVYAHLLKQTFQNVVSDDVEQRSKVFPNDSSSTNKESQNKDAKGPNDSVEMVERSTDCREVSDATVPAHNPTPAAYASPTSPIDKSPNTELHVKLPKPFQCVKNPKISDGHVQLKEKKDLGVMATMKDICDNVRISFGEQLFSEEPSEEDVGRLSSSHMIALVNHQVATLSSLLSYCIDTATEESSSVDKAADEIFLALFLLNKRLLQLQLALSREENKRKQLYNELMCSQEQMALMCEMNWHCFVHPDLSSNVIASQSCLNNSVTSSISKGRTEIPEEQKLPSAGAQKLNYHHLSQKFDKSRPASSSVIELGSRTRVPDVQRNVDKSAFEKMAQPIDHNSANLDLAHHKLVHHGPLTWHVNEQKTVNVHALLLDNVLVLVQEQDEKYILRFLDANLTRKKDNSKFMHSPVLQLRRLIVRTNATDERKFFVILLSERISYELVAATAKETKIWCDFLTEVSKYAKSHADMLRQTFQNVVSDHIEQHELFPDDSPSTSEDWFKSLKGALEAARSDTGHPNKQKQESDEDISSSSDEFVLL